MSGLLRAVDRILDGATLALLTALLLVVGAQIFARYVLNHSLFWSEELARYLFIYLVFLGAAIVLRREGHIRVSFFVEKLPPGPRRVVAVLGDILLLAFVGIVLIQSVRLAIMVWTVPTAALLIPWTFVYLGILLGMAAMVLVMLGALWRHLTGHTDGGRAC
ncbi:MAG: TRAP transporter small permease [candidate division NC10 bacterium]|nr:TRAP transporter small permease [candidate division NC10 bacterium]